MLVAERVKGLERRVAALEQVNADMCILVGEMKAANDKMWDLWRSTEGGRNLEKIRKEIAFWQKRVDETNRKDSHSGLQDCDLAAAVRHEAYLTKRVMELEEEVATMKKREDEINEGERTHWKNRESEPQSIVRLECKKIPCNIKVPKELMGLPIKWENLGEEKSDYVLAPANWRLASGVMVHKNAVQFQDGRYYRSDGMQLSKEQVKLFFGDSEAPKPQGTLDFSSDTFPGRRNRLRVDAYCSEEPPINWSASSDIKDEQAILPAPECKMDEENKLPRGGFF